jgi:hypothetical protein
MARFPDIAARVLRDANCSLPLSFSCTVNNKGSVSLLSNDPHTPATSYAPYFAPLSAALNKSFEVGNAPWDQFKPAPNEVQLAIHSLPIDCLAERDEDLFSGYTSLFGTRRASPYSRPATSTPTPSPERRRALHQSLSRYAHRTYSTSSPPSDSSRRSARSKEPTPPRRTPSAPTAGSSATTNNDAHSLPHLPPLLLGPHQGGPPMPQPHLPQGRKQQTRPQLLPLLGRLLHEL